MRGKTARQALRTDRRAECFNEAPLLCGERPSALGCLFRLLRASMRPRFYAGKDPGSPPIDPGINPRFNEAPLLCGERQL